MIKEDSRPKPLTELNAITTLDGRYREKTEALSPFVSEGALIRTRVEVEAKYLVALSEVGVVRKLKPEEKDKLLTFGQDLTEEETAKVKQIEGTIRHDVKAMERVFRGKLEGTSMEDIVEFVHFGLTSEDVNNLSYRLMLKRAAEKVSLPTIGGVVDVLVERADDFKNLPMLARTHGQAAVPTTLGKEMANFAMRLNIQLEKLYAQQLTGKLTGAVGNFNALRFASPDVDWETFSINFVKSLGLKPNLSTTQINPYDDLAEYFQNFERLNNTLIDFNQDVWRYISDNWFVQEARKGEVGSSTMPQKVNPIDFENSEGNLGMANAIFEFFARKLPVSRLQRDLSDSTVIRNIGTALGYSLVAYKSVLTGLSRIRPNPDKISKDLNKEWTILGEGVQTLLRAKGYDDPYSLVSSLTRGEHIDEEKWKAWVDTLALDDKEAKQKIRELTPEKYIGDAVELTERAIREIKKTRG